MTNRKIKVLVTAIGGGCGEQILKALRLADRSDRYWIIGADANRFCTQLSWVDQKMQLPSATAGNYMDCLLGAINEHGIDAVFPGCDSEMRRISIQRETLLSRGVFVPVNPASVIELCMDKGKTNHRLKELGFQPPRFASCSSRAELAGIDWFPVVVKPATGGGGSADVYIAQSARELAGLADFLGLGEQGNRFFIQEYVGSPDNEYTVGVLHDMDGNYINSIAVKRVFSGQLNVRVKVPNRSGRDDLGAHLVISSGVSQGFVGRFSDVTEPCRAIAAALGARGALNIQCRLVDGVVKVFEINPRFSGTTSLRAMVGYNEPDVLIRRHLFDEKVNSDFSYRNALILRTLKETEVEQHRI